MEKCIIIKFGRNNQPVNISETPWWNFCTWAARTWFVELASGGCPAGTSGAGRGTSYRCSPSSNHYWTGCPPPRRCCSSGLFPQFIDLFFPLLFFDLCRSTFSPPLSGWLPGCFCTLGASARWCYRPCVPPCYFRNSPPGAPSHRALLSMS